MLIYLDVHLYLHLEKVDTYTSLATENGAQWEARIDVPVSSAEGIDPNTRQTSGQTARDGGHILGHVYKEENGVSRYPLEKIIMNEIYTERVRERGSSPKSREIPTPNYWSFASYHASSRPWAVATATSSAQRSVGIFFLSSTLCSPTRCAKGLLTGVCHRGQR